MTVLTQTQGISTNLAVFETHEEGIAIYLIALTDGVFADVYSDYTTHEQLPAVVQSFKDRGYIESPMSAETAISTYLHEC